MAGMTFAKATADKALRGEGINDREFKKVSTILNAKKTFRK
jgi:hypothetical protein